MKWIVPEYSTNTEEPLGKLTGFGAILWKEVNQCEDETICSLAPESNNQISDLEDIEQENMEAEIPDSSLEIEVELEGV